jgi:hypothetical protein
MCPFTGNCCWGEDCMAWCGAKEECRIVLALEKYCGEGR